jgi:hypothetical protein
MGRPAASSARSDGLELLALLVEPLKEALGQGLSPAIRIPTQPRVTAAPTIKLPEPTLTLLD